MADDSGLDSRGRLLGLSALSRSLGGCEGSEMSKNSKYCPIKNGYCNPNCVFWSVLSNKCRLLDLIARLMGEK